MNNVHSQSHGKVDNTEDANAVFEEIQKLEPLIIEALSNLISKKPGINKIHIGYIAKMDLNALESATVALENALLDVTPVSSLPYF